ISFDKDGKVHLGEYKLANVQDPGLGDIYADNFKDCRDFDSYAAVLLPGDKVLITGGYPRMPAESATQPVAQNIRSEKSRCRIYDAKSGKLCNETKLIDSVYQ